ncbi:MAG: TIGR03790 family protein [Sedimentisphaerales bacterium]|nr:TIGR03790 family protein [Sedimentisphaerales bacterium]
MRYVKAIHVILFTCCLVFSLNPCAGLAPDEIALVVNSTSPDSMDVAQYYCQKRAVPADHIISVPMSDRESINRKDYIEKIAPAIRERLGQPDLKDKIKCLITVSGVPLRINSYVPQGQMKEWCDLVIKNLDTYFGELRQLTEDFQALANPELVGQRGPEQDKEFRLSRNPLDLEKEVLKMYQEATQAVGAAGKAIMTIQRNKELGYQEKVQTFARLYFKWSGLQGQAQRLAGQLQYMPDNQQKQNEQARLDEVQQRLESIKVQIAQINQEALDVTNKDKLYKLMLEAGGLQLLCHPNVLLSDRRQFDDQNSLSAFDSELTLVLWPAYPFSGHQPNKLLEYEYDLSKVYKTPEHNEPTLMVSRLDGPSLAIAKGLIDRALAAEQNDLWGKAYIDTRGIYTDSDQVGAYGYYDDKLRRTADLLRERTALDVITDNRSELFEPGACPSTMLYAGWYSLRNYIDSFDFLVGAVGVHIASYEAETLRTTEPGHRSENVWCKRMLEKGITATYGAVAEPYLYSFPRPDLFFQDLVSGQYCLAECFYRCNPYNSWMFTLIGDPLYRPRFAKGAGQIEPAPLKKPAPPPAPKPSPPKADKPSTPFPPAPSPPAENTPRKNPPEKRPAGGGFRPVF